jgi:hypothetical protein
LRCSASVGNFDVQATVAFLDGQRPPDLALHAADSPAATAQPTTSFEATTYRDPSSGFEFDYPAGWIVGPVEQYSRGGITAFTSWSRPADVLPGMTPAGETRLDATVQLWEPKNDFDAFLAQREGAWDGSGITVETEERWVLSDGRPAAAFVVQGHPTATGPSSSLRPRSTSIWSSAARATVFWSRSPAWFGRSSISVLTEVPEEQ